LAHFLLYCVKTLKRFTFEELNVWLKNKANWPSHVASSRRIRTVRVAGATLRLGAAETKTLWEILPSFLSTLPQLEGGVDIPTLSFLLHHDILSMVCNVNGLSDSDLIHLQDVIDFWMIAFCVSYKWVRPKTHDYCHFVESIKLFGNMRSYWTFGYESYHRLVKRLYHAGNKKAGFEQRVLEDLFFCFMSQQ
jgi:hypothetical protein